MGKGNAGSKREIGKRGGIRTVFYEDAEMLSAKGAHQERWKDLFQANLASLFELALLLTADPQEAEARLVGAIDTLDFSKQPDEDALAVLRMAIARQNTGTAGVASPAGDAEARSLLRTGLLPVLQLERSSRIWF